MKEIRLLYGTTVLGSRFFSGDLFWRTQFQTSSPIFFYELDDGHNVLLTNSLEYERAKKQANEYVVALLDEFLVDETKPPRLVDALIELLRHQAPEVITVHADTPCSIVEEIQKSGLPVRIHDESPWYPARASKNLQEVRNIVEVQRKVEDVMGGVVQILRDAKILPDCNCLATNSGELITSEYIRKFIDVKLAYQECLANGTIVVCGDQAVDPHSPGTGAILANSPIVIDIFPQSKKHSYCADMTRTFFKGKPTKEASSMYQTVLNAQRFGIDMIRAGVDGWTIQKAVEKFFDDHGYPKGERGGILQGGIHGFGHSIGLQTHEYPSITVKHQTLSEGCVVTAEPGLYYIGIGGVRIEDIVVVEKNGVKNLTSFPKELDEIIL